jgi:hypothetical protein
MNVEDNANAETATTDTTSTEGAGTNTTTQQTQTQQTGQGAGGGAAGGGERTFKQAEVDRIVEDRLARDRQARARTETTTTKTPERKPAGTEAERLDRIEQDNAFYRGLARLDTKLTEDQEADLLDLFRIHKPERPGDWLTERAARFGLGRRETTTTSTQTAANNANATTQSTTAAGGTTPNAETKTTAPPGSTTVPNKVNRLESGQLVDVSTLTDEERLQLGPQGMRQQLERVINAGQARDGRPPVPAVLRKK